MNSFASASDEAPPVTEKSKPGKGGRQLLRRILPHRRRPGADVTWGPFPNRLWTGNDPPAQDVPYRTSRSVEQNQNDPPPRHPHQGTSHLSTPDELYPIPVEDPISRGRGHDTNFSQYFSQPAEKICPTCQRQGGFFTLLNTSLGRSLTHVLDQSSQCSLCLLTVQVVSRHWSVAGFCDLSQVDDGCVIFLHRDNCQMGLRNEPKYILIHSKGEPEIVRAARLQLRAPALLLRPVTSSGSRLSTLIGDSVNWSWVLRWLNTCTTHHTNLCTPPHKLFDLQHFRVIDVRRRCVMDAPKNCAYVTLSYVWGAPKYRKLILTKANIKRLGQENALSNQVLPATLDDAIHACIAIDMPYLWIDSLCIVQDDPEIVQHEINRMGDIFSCSTLTLVGAAGDNADAGLPGVHSRLRNVKQGRLIVEHQEITEVLPNFAGVVDRSFWNTRGWTFQERFLSRRCIFFTEFQVYFRCQRCLRYEGGDLDGNWESLKGHVALGLFETGHVVSDPFADYEKTVEAYSKRSLSNQSDILNAFVGISSALYTPYRERFIFGLPESNFGDALLWYPDPADGAFRQRIAMSFMTLPSWSWISHQGHVIYDPEPMLGSLVEWYGFVDEAEGLIPFRVTNKRINDDPFSEDVADFGTTQLGHAPFRSKSPIPGTATSHSHFLGYDAHSNHRDAYREFPPEAVTLAQRAGRLLFRSQVASFGLRCYELAGDKGDSNNNVVKLTIIGSDSAIAGFINMDQTWVALYLSLDDELEGREFQFLALSAAETPKDWAGRVGSITAVINARQTARDVYNASRGQSPRMDAPPALSHKLYFDGSRGAALRPPPVVNVMLIEWQDGVARRLGLGKILLAAWKNANPLLKTVVLE